MKKFIVFLLIWSGLFFPFEVQAGYTCSDTTPNAYVCMADTCGSADVNDTITAVDAGGGGTAYMPTCTITWGISDKICFATTNSVKLLGQGVNSTKITMPSGYNPGTCTSSVGEAAIQIGRRDGVGNSGPKELGNFFIDMNYETGCSIAIQQTQCEWAGSYPYQVTCSEGGETTNFYYHDIDIHDAGYQYGGRFLRFIYNDNSVTLIQNVNLYSSVYHSGPYGFDPVAPWEADGNGFDYPPSYDGSTGGAVFIENCTVDGVYHPFDAFYATNIIFRYNDLRNNGSGTSGHEAGYTETAAYYVADKAGPNITIIYNNLIEDQAQGIYLRNGFYIITDNDITVTDDGMNILNPTSSNTGTDCTVVNDCPGTGWDGGAYEYTGFDTTTDCFQYQVGWIWGNTIVAASDDINYSTACSRQGKEILERAPVVGDVGYNGTFSKSICPHPLTGLSGTCNDNGYGIEGYNIVSDNPSTPSGSFTFGKIEPKLLTAER